MSDGYQFTPSDAGMATRIQFRWLEKRRSLETGYDAIRVLQFRTLEAGLNRGYNGWTDWRDVPTEVVYV